MKQLAPYHHTAPRLVCEPCREVLLRITNRLDLEKGEQGAFVLAMVRHTIQEFDVSLEELHNDSTTITFSGNYSDAATRSEAKAKTPPSS